MAILKSVLRVVKVSLNLRSVTPPTTTITNLCILADLWVFLVIYLFKNSLWRQQQQQQLCFVPHGAQQSQVAFPALLQTHECRSLMVASKLYQAVSTNWGAIQRLTRCLLGTQLQVNVASRLELFVTNCRHNPPSGQFVHDGREAHQWMRSPKPGTELNMVRGQA